MSPNPDSLAAIATETLAGGRFSYLLGDFLDAFYREPRAGALTEPPTPMTGLVEKGDVYDAFLGAVAESLARRFGLPMPKWAFEKLRWLPYPYFPIESPRFRATLLLESPMEFRSRNLFVTANALSRA